MGLDNFSDLKSHLLIIFVLIFVGCGTTPDPDPPPLKAVFLGDSLTFSWDLAQSFPGQPYVNRGTPGNSVFQMADRFATDVIALQPDVVIILAGTNDVGHHFLDGVSDQFRRMITAANANHIAVILATLPPMRGSMSIHNPEIVAFDNWLKAYAGILGIVVADYYAALVDDKGELDLSFADGEQPRRFFGPPTVGEAARKDR